MKFNNKKIIAILPMKAHSERIPNKNVRKLGNKILFIHILEKLKATNIFSKVVINTDSKKIKDIVGKKYKKWVKIHDRPDHLLGDNVSMNRIISYDLKKFDDECTFFQTHSTNPFLASKTIIKAVDSYKKEIWKGKYDSLFSVNLIKSRLYDNKMRPINHNPKILRRTQDLANIYEENSNFYIFSKKAFLENDQKRIGKKPFMYVMDTSIEESLDLDEPKHWKLAEKIINSKII
tara:strand:+ start:13055 stop:13756 length:702 start_codon:yes stop_codon:yes gene_type:complete